ncbi:DUF1810 family protein, partial [Flavobacterium sp. LBUM151]
IKNADEAMAYLEHPILGKHLLEITKELINTNEKSALEILGDTDAEKLKSSMTLFANIQNTEPVFEDVINKYFGGSYDFHTIQLLYSNL